MSKNHRNYIIIAILFVVLFLVVRLKTVHEEASEKIYDIIPTSTNEGFTLKSLQRNLSAAEKDLAKAIIALRPGETYRGTVLVKNYSPTDTEFTFKYFDDIKPFNEETEDNIEIEVLTPLPFTLKGREWRVIPYIVHVSRTAEEKTYKGVMATGSTKLIKREGTNLALLVGMEMEIEVAQEPTVYEYKTLMEEITPEDFLWKFVYREFERILAGVFAILAVYFIYMAFKKKA